MKVGDYVRTKEFGIQKVKWFDNEEPILENGFTALQSSGYKSSSNLIDLIEVGDYINGHKVFDDMRVDTDDYGNDFIEIGIEIDNMLNHYIREEDIKSIVTKEQFESMKYKVKE